jgi:hypothetical protein
MFTAGGAARGHYRGRRRAGFVRFAFSDHPEVTVVTVLLVAVALTLLVRTVAIGSSAQPASTVRAEEPVASPGPHEPVVMPGQLPPAASSSPSTGLKTTPSQEAAGAIPPTTSPVPVPSQALISYEAEAADTIRAPGVSIRSLAIASGGQYIGNVGRGNAVRFPNVAAEGSGDYTLTIYYLSAEIRTAELRINGGPPQLLTFAPSGGWQEVAAIALRVQLLVGLNTIELGNPDGQPSPDLDRITLQG